MEIEKDKWVEIDRKGKVSTQVYIPSNYAGPIALDATIYQPERLNPEDAISSVCDSPNSTNK